VNREATIMTTIKLITRSLLPTLVLALVLPACGGDKADAGKKADAAKKGDAGKQASADSAGPADEPADDVPALDPKVEKAVTLANKLAAEPSRADAILEEAGMDRQSFQTLLYEIAHDPELSKSYAVAREA
jgi:hypothetical protein